MKLKHYLIASPENHYQPWILSKTAMACFIISVWAMRLFLPSYIAISAPGLDAQDLIARVNEERTNRLLPALITNTKLTNAAVIKSQDMIDRDYFAHVNPDGDYVWPVIEAQGYKPYQSLGENLAVDFISAEAIVKAWMNSPGHRANILNEKFEDQGMAAVYGEFEGNRQTYLVTNLFGALLKKVASSNTTVTPQQPAPPAPQPAVVTPQPEPQPNDLVAEDEKLEAETPNPEATPPATTQTEVSRAQNNGLLSMKILIILLASTYTILLTIDSLIIYRARIQRTNLSSSPHSLLLILISLVNFLTLWL